jgi:hypothetical protein
MSAVAPAPVADRARARAERLVESRRAELAAACCVLLALGAAAFGSHVLAGGFYTDDWSNASASLLQAGGDLGHLLDYYWELSGYRPATVLYVPLTFKLLGVHTGWHLAWLVTCAALLSTAFFALLRELGLPRGHAIAIASLLLLLPASDSSRLWTILSFSSLAISCWLVGVIVAIRAFQATGRRALLLHAASLGLYALALLGYEVSIAAMAISALLYALRVPWRRALRRLPFDVAVCLFVYFVFTSAATPHEIQWAALDDRLRLFWDDGRQVIVDSILPFGAWQGPLVSWLVIALLLAGVAVWRLLPAHDAARRQLGLGLLVTLAGVIATAAAWAVFVPAEGFYRPLIEGQGNRTNIFAGLGIVTTVYGTLLVAATLAFRGLPRWRTLSAATVAALTVAILAGYLVELTDDKRIWDRAAAHQQDVLAGIYTLTPQDMPAGTTLYSFNTAVAEAGDIPIFAVPWDLSGALRLRYDEWDIQAYPMREPATVECRADAIVPVGGFDPNAPSGSYGKTWFVDVTTRRAELVDSRSDCMRIRGGYKGGPLYPPPPQ